MAHRPPAAWGIGGWVAQMDDQDTARARVPRRERD
jgi:hypothetical protein